MKNNKLQVGDLVLITGPSHYDKATVVSVEKGKVTLDNQMVIDHSYHNLVRSQMQASPWDEKAFNLYHANQKIPKILTSMQRNWKDLPEDRRLALCSKLEHLLEKFNIPIF